MPFVLAGIIFAILLTSRYSVIILCGVSIIILWRIQKKSTYELALFSLPIMISGIMIYLFTLQYQNPSGTPPAYINDYLLKGKDVAGIVKLFGYNLFSKAALPLTGFLLLYSIYRIMFRPKGRFIFLESYRYLFWVSVLLHAFHILLAFAGKYPWSIPNRFGIALQVCSVASLFSLVAIADQLLSDLHMLGRHWTNLCIALVVIVTSTLIFVSFLKQTPTDTTFYNLRSLEIGGVENESFYVSHSSIPTVRYLIEYGPLSSLKEHGYPKNFFFDQCDSSKHDTWQKYDYFVFGDSVTIRTREWKNFAQQQNLIDLSIKQNSDETATLFRRK